MSLLGAKMKSGISFTYRFGFTVGFTFAPLDQTREEHEITTGAFGVLKYHFVETFVETEFN